MADNTSSILDQWEEIKVLDLKKESLNDKVSMQEKFIDDVETRGK